MPKELLVPCDSCGVSSKVLYKISKGHYEDVVEGLSAFGKHWVTDEHIITLCKECYVFYPNG